jgi:TM2 domain-containing membrane protein YozV
MKERKKRIVKFVQTSFGERGSIMYSVGIAYLLWLLSGFGALGLHRFYLGKIPTGILWMFTGGLCMVGSIVDFFTLGSQVKKANMERALYNAYRDALYTGGNPLGKKVRAEAESVERSILKAAKQNNGVLTPGDVALIANISLEQAKKELDALAAKGFAEMRVRKTGAIAYVIPDMADNSPFEDF